MKTIQSLIDAIIRRCQGSAGPIQVGHVPPHGGNRPSTEASESNAPPKVNYFEFACCYHTSGLCLLGVKGIR